MERVRMMLSEATIQLHEPQGSKQVAYHRYLAAAFTTAKIMSKTFVFQDDHTTDKRTFERLAQIITLSLEKAESLLESVVEMDGDVLEMIKNSGSQVAGLGGEPLIVDTTTIFTGHEDLVKRYGLAKQDGNEKQPMEPVTASQLPLIPESRLRLDIYALQYHLQLLMQKLADFERRPAKEQSNAIFLACLQHTFSDFFKVIERFMQVEEDMAGVETLQLRNELMTVDKIAAEIHLIDRLVWSRLVTDDLLGMRLKPVNTVKPCLDYFHYIVSFTIDECVKCQSARECAETMVFLIHIADRLKGHYGNYNTAAAITMALDEAPIKQKWKDSFALLPEKVQKMLNELRKGFDSGDHYTRCLEQVGKNATAIPPIIAIVDRVKSTATLELPDDLKRLLKRVVKSVVVGGFTSKRPDIQHWLLTRPFHVSFDEKREEQDGVIEDKVPVNHSIGESTINIIPDSLLNLPDPIDGINDDQYEQIFGVHAK